MCCNVGQASEPAQVPACRRTCERSRVRRHHPRIRGEQEGQIVIPDLSLEPSPRARGAGVLVYPGGVGGSSWLHYSLIQVGHDEDGDMVHTITLIARAPAASTSTSNCPTRTRSSSSSTNLTPPPATRCRATGVCATAAPRSPTGVTPASWTNRPSRTQRFADTNPLATCGTGRAREPPQVPRARPAPLLHAREYLHDPTASPAPNRPTAPHTARAPLPRSRPADCPAPGPRSERPGREPGRCRPARPVRTRDEDPNWSSRGFRERRSVRGSASEQVRALLLSAIRACQPFPIAGGVCEFGLHLAGLCGIPEVAAVYRGLKGRWTRSSPRCFGGDQVLRPRTRPLPGAFVRQAAAGPGRSG